MMAATGRSKLTMRSAVGAFLTTVAAVELPAWLPLSWTGVVFNAGYVVAGNSPPPTLIWGFFFVPLTFLAGPIYALMPHGRAHPKVAMAALAVPLCVLAITYFNSLPFLTHAPL